MTGGLDGPPRGGGHMLVASIQTRSRGEKPNLTRVRGSPPTTGVSLQHWYMGVWVKMQIKSAEHSLGSAYYGEPGRGWR